MCVGYAAVCYAENGDEKVGGASPAPYKFSAVFQRQIFQDVIFSGFFADLNSVE